jgi:hypothetical protein
MYRLKPNQSPFEVVDGPFAGQKYAHGLIYTDIPSSEAGRFEPIEQPAPAEAATRPTKKKSTDEVADNA